jgi:hypothetical protein
MQLFGVLNINKTAPSGHLMPGRRRHEYTSDFRSVIAFGKGKIAERGEKADSFSGFGFVQVS